MSAVPSASGLYAGRLTHRRREPFEHRFDYPLCMLLVDLAGLDRLFAGRWLWSVDRRNLVELRTADHLPEEGGGPLEARARDAVERRLGFRPRGAVRLLTHPRHLGYAFNPVSFFLCYDGFYDGCYEHRDAAHDAAYGHDQGQLAAILAEVTNTPWNDRHVYALDCRGREQLTFRVPKRLHVSPFLPMDMAYRFVFRLDAGRIVVHKENLQDGRVVFSATLDLERRPLTGSEMAGALLRYPLMPWQVVGRIYWQALRLWWKGARYHARPDPSGSN